MAKKKISDEDLLVGEVIRAIRGPLSQGQVLVKLGIAHNVVAKWENGHTRIRWGQFIDLALACGRPLKAATNEAYKYNHIPRDARKFLINLFGLHLDSSQLPSSSELGAYKIKNIFLGKNDPFLDEVFILLKRTGNLIFWLGKIISRENWPNLIANSFNTWEKISLVIPDHPLIVPIFLLLQDGRLNLQTESVVKSIANMFFVESGDVTHTLNLMHELKLITIKTKQIEMGPNVLPPTSSSIGHEKVSRLDQFWHGLFYKKFREQGPTPLMARGMALTLGSQEDLDALISLMRKFQGSILEVEKKSNKNAQSRGLFTVQVQINYSSIDEK